MRRVLLSWSGGKDSCLALDELRRSHEVEVAALLTTITEGAERVGMHAVRRSLIAAQAERLGIPLHPIMIPGCPSNEVYERRMGVALAEHRERGIEEVAFGDLFLEEIRAYRETMLASVGMRGLYPIWGRDTAELARGFVGGGFRAILVCVDTRALDRSFAGRLFDADLLSALPAGVDPCGERGEFHTFVFDGPGFASAVRFAVGETTVDGPHAFADLVPVE